jgi:GMP synthase (glutamine-hydrolysing)
MLVRAEAGLACDDVGESHVQSGRTQRDGRASPVLRPDALKPVLVIVHQDTSNPGHVGQWFSRAGHRLDIRRPYAGQDLPDTLEDHCGAVIFGGPQSANDRFAYIRQEIDWIGVALKEQKPFFGVCLGAQMLAHHLGARVDYCRNGHVEIGYHALKTTQAGRALCEFPEHAYQWHREGFELPRDGVLLATSDSTYANQAFQYGPAAYGVQFHPEITHVQINAWSGGNPMRLLMRGARPRQRHFDDHLAHAARVRVWLDAFLRQVMATPALPNRPSTKIAHEFAKS